MTTPKQLSEAEITSNDRGFCNDLRVFDNKDNLLKNWTGKAILGFCMYDDNDGYQEWNVTTTPYRDKANGYRVRECYIAHSEAEQPVKQVKSAEEILNPYVQTPDEAPDYVFLFQALQAMHEYASQFQTPALGISEGSQQITKETVMPKTKEKASQEYADAINLNLAPTNQNKSAISHAAKVDFIAGFEFCEENYHTIDPYPMQRLISDDHWTDLEETALNYVIGKYSNNHVEPSLSVQEAFLQGAKWQSSQPQPNAISIIEERIQELLGMSDQYDQYNNFDRIDELTDLLKKLKKQP